MDILPAKEQGFSIQSPRLNKRAPSRKVIGFFVDVNDVWAGGAQFTRQCGIMMQMVAAIEANRNRSQAIAFNMTSFQDLFAAFIFP